MAEGVLPENLEEFRSVEYWDAFFRARKSKAFEWYGEWQQLRHLLRPLCTLTTRVLVVGCGNSELSADMCAGCMPTTSSSFSRPCVVLNFEAHCIDGNKQHLLRQV